MQNAFCLECIYKFLFLVQKSDWKKKKKRFWFWLMILIFAKANGSHPTRALIAPTTHFLNFFFTRFSVIFFPSLYMFTVTSKTKNHNKITQHSQWNKFRKSQAATNRSIESQKNTHTKTNKQTKEYVEQQKKKIHHRHITSTGSIDLESQIK